MSKKAPLQFVPFNSCLDTGFWQKLSEKKLNVYGLDDQPLEIHGFYFNGDQPGVPCVMNVDFTAFDRNFQTPVKHFKTRGTLNNTNTLNRFKECDKKELLNSVGRELWNDICSGRATDDTSLLSRFYLLTYADLKKYHYYYWFSFPCLCFPGDVSLLTEPLFLGNHFTSQQLESFLTNYDIFQNSNREWVGYFAVTVENETISFQQLKDIQNTSIENKKVIFCFCDPSSMDEFPGWPLRNFLLLIAYHWRKFTDIEVICLRDRAKDGVRSIAQSLVLNIHLGSSIDFNDVPKCVGWEKNERQKLGPRMVNLSSSMDPSKLAESAVDLNLKLMRWRLIPELNLEKVANTKCLLLGSGTLGCNIARCLMGWGVRNITFVDNGKVSYSNPVRQSLFVFDDCMLGGRPKAEAAAEALKRIFPGVNADAVNLSIPMPGHHIPESLIEQTQKDVDRLTELIENHDVVFLLMDTRESRWLPTLIAAAKYKLVINAALGFDTFLVLRHGMKTDEPQTVITKENFATLSSNIPGSQLGCYFCNDVVAPGNSTKDRTLDQQCTVSRPGMSMIASALAVELMVSILQHKLGPLAPADTSSKDEHITMELTSSLGLVPHQIRGFLSRFHNIMPANRAFNKCTACSDIVIENYRTHGFDFLIQAFNDTSYLEDITGLTQMHQETIDAEVIYLSDDDDGSSCVDST